MEVAAKKIMNIVSSPNFVEIEIVMIECSVPSAMSREFIRIMKTMILKKLFTYLKSISS